ncbi:MAG: hypothetical protein Kow00117_01240 [Phototrophicales bacterium]
MTITYAHGDPLQTNASTLAFGYNAQGRIEVSQLVTRLLNIYPAAFAAFKKQCRAGVIKAGQYWIWRDAKPHLMFMVVRASPVGATRLRYVQSVMLSLARDYQREGIQDIAITALGSQYEWQEIKLIIETWLTRVTLPVMVYEE